MRTYTEWEEFEYREAMMERRLERERQEREDALDFVDTPEEDGE